MSKTKKIVKKIKTKQVNKTEIKNDDELKKLVKIIGIILAIFLVIFLVTSIVTKTKEEEPTEATIQYKDILIGNIFNQSTDEYYVLIEKQEDPYITLYESYLTKYTALSYYTANLDSVFNKRYIGEKTETNVTDAKDLKFVGTTLVRVKNDKIVSIYDTKTKILNQLKTMIK